MPDDLRVMVTIMEGEHRIHVNGSHDKVVALCEIGAPDFNLYAGTPRQIASAPDLVAKRLFQKWRGASGSPSLGQLKMRAASEVLIPFQRAWNAHIVLYPECKALLDPADYSDWDLR